ncbi:response regulator [Jannaschia sp. CCS1]|uniref:response regulator n=1 Tax=Jannaschia sp. (strain CCS1) TaxID=290400 RepID=UPI000053B6C3|nr:response regulator transcription factor [Jannaschia sp. CCS1]ABD54931.1 two component transcriptional regulator, winged helix family [Jannaschia sp. CCS1]
MTDAILLVEDDTRLAEMVASYLGGNGFDVSRVDTGEKALGLQGRQSFEAMILDLNLPGIDGLEVCRHVKAQSALPIIMLTAKGDPMDRIIGLEIGADDYLPKPFEPRELLARLRAVMRRGQTSPHAGSTPLQFGRLQIDPGAMVARVDGRPCDLTTHQFQILLVLARAAGRVLSRDALMDALRGEALEAFDRSIDVHVSRIRAEIEDDPKHPRRIITVRGAGYVFARIHDGDKHVRDRV